MIRLGRFQVSVEGLLALGLLVALTLGGVRCAAYRQGGDDARLAQLEANAHKVAKAGLVTRRTVDSVTRKMTNRIAANRKVEVRLSARLAANDSLLADSAFIDNPDIEKLSIIRAALAQTTEVARVYRDSTNVLLASIPVLIAAHDAEREANTKLVAAKDSVISALTARECRVLGMRCPSRRTAFAAGVVLTLAAVVAK